MHTTYIWHWRLAKELLCVITLLKNVHVAMHKTNTQESAAR